MELTEAKEIKKCQEYREKLHTPKKDFNDLDNHDGVVTHLGTDILECEVKWVLGSITANKARGGTGIPAELLQIVKDNAVKVLHSICQDLENAVVVKEMEMVSFLYNLKERQCQRMFKLPHICAHFTF